MNIDTTLLQKCLKYIDGYWEEIIYSAKESQGNPHTIPLPHTFLSTNAKDTSHWKGAMFYWDSFFMFRGLIGTQREWIMPGMVDNFIYLFRKYGIIPNANFWGFLVSSQPPFLSSMVFDAYYAIQRGGIIRKTLTKPYAALWLRNRIKYVERQYWQVWEDTSYYHHKVETYGLSKYGDRDVGYQWNAERESGWDFTTRFYNRCHEFLPVDLNSFLHKYEKDLAKASHILRRKEEEILWDERANERYQRIKKYMWNEKKGFYFDYDFVNKKQSDFYSLAGFVPLWGKLATFEEAKKVLRKLSLFETDYGLTITAKVSHPTSFTLNGIPHAFRPSVQELLTPKQWDYPNIWPPLEYLTVIGLLRYGFLEDAIRIMTKSIQANMHVFEKYGGLLEKIDGITGEKPKAYWYKPQLGFGWTNAIFYRYVQILDYIRKMNGDIYGNQPQTQEPPYSLTSILH